MQLELLLVGVMGLVLWQDHSVQLFLDSQVSLVLQVIGLLPVSALPGLVGPGRYHSAASASASWPSLSSLSAFLASSALGQGWWMGLLQSLVMLSRSSA